MFLTVEYSRRLVFGIRFRLRSCHHSANRAATPHRQRRRCSDSIIIIMSANATQDVTQMEPPTVCEYPALHMYE